MKNLLLLLCFLPFALPAQEAVKHIDKEAIHYRMRQHAYPAGGEVVKTNPVALLWPVVREGKVSYGVRLSQDPNFSEGKTIAVSRLPWAMYNTHRKLAKGTWYWQYQINKKGEYPQKSEVYQFEITDDVDVLETPTIHEFLDIVKGYEHPRIFLPPNQLNDFRLRNADSKDAKKVIQEATKNLNQELIPEAPTRPRDTTGVEGFEKKVLMRFMYHRFGEVVRQPIENQALAYLLTQDDKYAKEALRQALHIAGMDPKGPATQEDFNAASAMLAMATAYDVAYPYMSEAEKESLKKAIKVRGDHFFRSYANMFEAHGMDNHVWQHTLRRFFMTAIAMVGEIDDADQWLSFCYEVWCSRFPVLGGRDGGWHDGSSYYQVNFETFILMPKMLKNLTGVDFFDIPWFKNAGKFLAYSFPKNSYSTGFGDGFEAMLKPNKKYIAYADALAREVGDPIARAYANNLVNGDLDKLGQDKDFRLYRLLTEKKATDTPQVSLDSIPTAGYFPDAGFALFHTNMAKTRRNLMLSFFSVPFGATGHAHAAQNGFTISYGGKQLFGGSGYYSNFNDPHTLKHYRTRGHNTILADNKAMVIGENGYGWIPRFANTEALGYALGDGSHAFGDMTAEFWLDRMEKSKVEYTAENGFGNPKVKHFRRHIALLRPNMVVIYDELEAEQAINWSWLLHSYQKMVRKDGALWGENEFANAQVYLFSSDKKLKHTITNEYFEPAVNWKKKPVNGSIEYAKNWHANFDTKGKSKKMRFLALIRIDEKKNELIIPKITDKDIRIKGWSISAEMDASKPARLEIMNKKGDGIYYNSPRVKSKLEGSTIIFDKNSIVEELVDKLPISR